MFVLQVVLVALLVFQLMRSLPRYTTSKHVLGVQQCPSNIIPWNQRFSVFSCQKNCMPQNRQKKTADTKHKTVKNSSCPDSWTLVTKQTPGWAIARGGFQIFPTKPINSKNSLATEEQNNGQSFSSNALHRKFPSSTFLLDRRNLAKELGDKKMRHVPRVLQMIFSGREIWSIWISLT